MFFLLEVYFSFSSIWGYGRTLVGGYIGLIFGLAGLFFWWVHGLDFSSGDCFDFSFNLGILRATHFKTKKKNVPRLKRGF